MNRERRPRSVPRVTLLLAITTFTAFILPEVGTLLIDRADTAITGEGWRWFTGHLVHATLWHLLFDLALFVPLAVILERRLGSVKFACTLALLAGGVAFGVRTLHDGWTTYAGLSGVVYGLVPLVLLPPTGRLRIGLAVVTVITVKSALEYSGAGWLAASDSLGELFGVRYLAGSHLAGLATGLLMVAVGRLRPARPSAQVAAA